MSRHPSSAPPGRPDVEPRKASDRLRTFCLQLFHLAPVGHVLHDPRGLVEEANYTAGSMLGVPAHELRGERLTSLASQADAARMSAHFAHTVLTGERCKIQLRLQRPGGTRFFATLESVALDPPGPETRVLTTIFDDTDRVRAEARLLEREATLTAVLGAVRDAVIGVDEHAAIRAFEGGAERIFGLRKQDVLGKHVGMLFDVTAPPASRGSTDRPPRARGRRSDGTRFEAEVSIHGVAGASYTVLVVRDVTRDEELARALMEAQRLEIAGRLAAGVAHDTNNLLMRILSATDALADIADPDVLKERAREVRRAAEGGSAIVQRLAALIGAHAGEPAPLEIDRAVESLRTVLEPLLAPAVSLSLRLDAPGMRVSMQPGRIEQIVLNLAVNARDAMPDGGELVIATRALETSLGDLVEITVCDTGVGMTEAVRARIFDATFTTKETGTGLGLATVASIVERAGGRIEVESAPRAGSTFRIELPAERAARADAPVRRVPPSTLLLAASDTLVRSTLRAHLERGGHRVLEAEGPHDVLDRCRSYPGPIHAVLLDMGPSAAELGEEARAIHPEASVLFLSSAPRAELVSGGRLASGVFILPLPCSERELEDALARVLEPPARRGRVLVVEDDPLIRMTLERTLRREGFEVGVAGAIAEAVLLDRIEPADVIVSDDHLPDGRAADVLRELRRRGDERPVILLSGLGPGDDAAMAKALHAARTAFVQKPVDFDVLLSTIDSLLRR